MPMTTKQAAEYLGIDEQMVRYYRRINTIKAKKLDGRYFYTKGNLDKFKNKL